MEVSLVRAKIEDADEMWKIQVTAFKEMLDYYQDYDTSPGNESLEVIQDKIQHSYFYFIRTNGKKVGGIRIKILDDGKKSISPLFVMPEYRDRGIAQKAIRLCENIHGSDCWILDTIMEEAGNCHLYEKMGYHATGHKEKINDKLTLVFYAK